MLIILSEVNGGRKNVLDQWPSVYEGVGDEPVDIQTGKFEKIFTLRRFSTATPIYSNRKCAP